MKNSTAILLGFAAILGTAPSSAAIGPESSCGRVSVFDAAPRQQRLYRVVLIAIDSKSPAPSTSAAFRLQPGKHTLTVAEAIDSAQFGPIQQLRRDGRNRRRYKDLELEVRAGITYRVAAQFDLAKRHEFASNGYWNPVIWREVEERCD